MAGSSRFAIAFTALAGASAVGLGAFGAHGLKEVLRANGTAPLWETAVLYHLVHSVALLAVVGAGGPVTRSKGKWTVRAWAVGIVLFSGSLYALALGAPRWVGAIVPPLGGTAFIVGWLALGWAWWRGGETVEPRG